MANHASAKKEHRQSLKRNLRNSSVRSKIHTFSKKVLNAVELKDFASASELLSAAESEIMKGVKKGVLKLNTAARRVSALKRKVKSLETKKG